MEKTCENCNHRQIDGIYYNWCDIKEETIDSACEEWREETSINKPSRYYDCEFEWMGRL